MRYVIVVSYFVISVMLLLVFSCKPSSTETFTHDGLLQDVYGDAENGKWFSGNFVNNGHEFSGKKMQSSQHAHSGSYSCEVNKTAEFGLGTTIENVPQGSYVQVSVWRYSTTGKGGLHVSSDKVGNIYYLESKPLIIDSNGWQKIVVNVPINQEIDRLKIACYNPNDSSAFFDDLSIKLYKSRPIYYELGSEMNIHLSDSNYKVLLGYREVALSQKVISQDLKKYVKATIIYQGDSIPVKMRFKGDWTDHLVGDKWSFRIKVGRGYSIKGLKSFSIQSPETRGFMNEWFMHKIFDNQGLLTTRYDFIPVALNGKNLGLFAMEEHFDKQLIESRERREGPILKMDEEGFWERELYRVKESFCYNIPYYEAAAVLPFKRKRTFKNETLKDEFLIAKNLVYQYKSYQTPIEDVMDLEALAAYHALFDLGGVLHGQGWHNQRLYYNPITSKMEPIAYDLFTDDIRLVERKPILGINSGNELNIEKNRFLNQSVFNQASFQEMYYHKLKDFSNPDFLDNQLKEMQLDLDSLSDLLGKEYGGYAFDAKPFYVRATDIKKELSMNKSILNGGMEDFKILKETYDDLTERPVYYAQSGLKAYSKRRDSIKTVVQMVNFHTGPLEVIGYGLKVNEDSLVRISTPINISGYSVNEPIWESSFEGEVTKLYFHVPAFGDSIFDKKVVGWSYPDQLNPRMEIENSFNPNSNNFRLDGNTITLNKKLKLNKILFIPKGYQLVIEPGTKVVLDEKGGILSYSPVRAIANQNNPISIQGVTENNQGFQVLTNNDSSQFHFVDFYKMSSLNYKGWTLTGGVTVYKGMVDLFNCSFKNNNCEDGLNLINTTFNMNNCLVYGSFSDGFDGDFCTGLVKSSQISNTGNDGLDFSGSTIQIINTTVLIPGDKAISGGEQSSLKVDNCQIRGSKLGVVAKDNSIVSVSNSEFHFCQTPFAVFQKKDEYGPAFIYANENKKFESGNEFLIGKGCFVLEDKVKFNEVNLHDINTLY